MNIFLRKTIKKKLIILILNQIQLLIIRNTFYLVIQILQNLLVRRMVDNLLLYKPKKAVELFTQSSTLLLNILVPILKGRLLFNFLVLFILFKLLSIISFNLRLLLNARVYFLSPRCQSFDKLVFHLSLKLYPFHSLM